MNLAEMTHPQLVELSTNSQDKEELRLIANHLELSFSGNTGIDTLRNKILEDLADDGNDDSIPVHETPPDLQAMLDAASVSGSQPEVVSVPETTPAPAPVAPAAQVQPALTQNFVSAPQSSLDRDDNVEIQVAKVAARTGPTDAELLMIDPNTIGDVKVRRRAVRLQALRLVRCKITNLDPADAELPGELVTVSNKYIGKVSKLIPFTEAGDSYHLEYCLMMELKSRKFALRKKLPGEQFGVPKYKTVMAPKFAIEILPDLTPQELQELARHQQAAGTVGNDN